MVENATDTNPDVDTSHWLDDFTGISGGEDYEDVKKLFAKYDKAENPVEAALLGAVDAQKKIGLKVQVPDSFDELTDEQKADVMVKVAKMQGVPENAEGYEVVKPKLPEGVNYDEEGEKMARELAVNHKLPNAVLQDMVNVYNTLMVKRLEGIQKDEEKAATKALTDMEIAYGGKAGLKTNTELVKRMLMHQAGDSEEEQKALIACLDMTHLVDTKDGKQKISLGNMVPLHRALARIATRLEAEGETFGAESAEPKVTEKSLRESRFPKSPQMDKK